MPRASDGTHSLPPGTLVSSGDTVLVSQHNPAMQDISTSLTNSLDRDGRGGMRANLPMGGKRITNLAAGVDSADAATMAQLSNASGAPIGAIFDYAGSTAPSGYFLCYGQAISRSTYADLFAAIGTTYGSGDGSTTFNLPDCRGRSRFGKDDMGGAGASRLTNAASGVSGDTLGATGGAQTVTLTESQMPAHTHTLSGSTSSGGAHTHTTFLSPTGGAAAPGGGFVAGSGSSSTSSNGAHTHTLSGSAASTGGGGAHNNVPPAIVFNTIIRAL